MRRHKPRNLYVRHGHPLLSGLHIAWVLTEGAGDVIKAYPPPTKATRSTGSAIWRHSDMGCGLYFNNSTYFTIWPEAIVDVGVRPFAYPMTIVAGVRNVKGNDNGMIIYGSRDTSGDGYGGENETHLSTITGGRFNIFVRTNGVTHVSLDTTASHLNEAVVVAAVVDTTSAIYVNGLEEISGAITGTPDFSGYSGNWRIGAPGATKRYFNGDLWFLYIYHRALTPKEIRELYTDPYAMFRKPTHHLAGALHIPGTTNVSLSWHDNSEHEDGFVIERAMDGGAFSEIDTVPAGSESYNDSVETGHTYTYRVKATSAALGDSEYSNEAEVTV